MVEMGKVVGANLGARVEGTDTPREAPTHALPLQKLRSRDLSWSGENALWKRLGRDGLGNRTFTGAEAAALRRYADSAENRPLSGVLLHLLSERIDPTQARGKVAHDTLVELKLLHPFVDQVLDLLRTSGPAFDLTNVRFHYYGHMTRATMSLFQILRGLNLGVGSATRTYYSGTYPVEMVLERQLFADRLEKQHVEGIGTEIISDPKKLRTHIVSEAYEARARGEIFVVDRGGDLVAGGPLGDDVLAMIRQGDIRFVMHNTNDRTALFAFKAQTGIEPWIVDLAGSRIKALEGRVIGEQYALLAQRLVRTKWRTRMGDLPVVVKGFGLLGESVVRALRRLGMPASQITVVEPREDRRLRAAKRGCTVLAQDERRDVPKSVVFVATAGLCMDAHNVVEFAKETMVIPLTSGGKGVDVESIFGAHEGNLRTTDSRSGGHRRLDNDSQMFTDVAATLPDGSGSLRTAHLINCARQAANLPYRLYPLNLVEAPWADRFSVTASAVALAVSAAKQMQAPGTVGLPRTLETQTIRLFHKHGLHELQALDEGVEPWSGLTVRSDDLRAFTPAAAPARTR